MSSLRPRGISVLLLLAGAGTLGCNDESSPTVPDPGTSKLECEIQNYPCSLAEVDLSILLRSNELGNSALAMLEDGASTSDAADWLRGQEGMADVMSGDLGVWFRLEEGRGTWVVTEGAVLAEPGPSADAVGPVTPQHAPPDHVHAPLAPESRISTRPGADAVAQPSASGRSETSLSAHAILAEHSLPLTASRQGAPSLAVLDPPQPRLDIVGSGSDKKRALVLSPFLWEFKDWDAGLVVRDILASTRGYDHENGVTFVANGDSTSTDVGLASFMGWSAYDVVHVTSHGLRVCDEDGCRGILAVNTVDAFFPAGLSEAQQVEKLKELNQTGVEIKKSPEGDYVAVNADFFWSHANDLVDTLIFINSCQIFGGAATDLVDALTGTANVVFGWTEAVYARDAITATRRLFTELSEGGYPAEVAHERVGGLRMGLSTPHGPAPVLRIAPRPSGGDLQIREVVTLLHPGSGRELTATDRVQIEGIQGDGEEDEVPFSVRVDGVLPEQAPDMILHVSVDGVQAEPVTVGSGTPNDENQWIIEGRIPLGYDLEEDREVDFLARVELMSEGESEHRSGATLTGASWTLETEGSMTGEVTLHGVTELGAESWTAQAYFGVDGQGRVVGDGLGILSGTELLLSYDDEELYCLVAAPVELGFAFDLTGRVEGGRLRMQSTNLRIVEFSASEVCEGITEEQIRASFLNILSATLETDVPFEHEAVQEVEVPQSGPLSHDGVEVGSYQTIYQWTNTIRKEGCPVGGGDDEC